MKIIVYTLVGLSLCLSSGCSWIARKSYKESVGAQSECHVITIPPSGGMRGYGGYELAPVRSDLGGQVGGAFRSSLPISLRAALNNKKEPVFTGNGPKLTIEPCVTFFMMKGGLKQLIGMDSYAACVFFLREGKQEVARVEIVSRSGANHTDQADLARDMAKTLAEFLRGEQD